MGNSTRFEARPTTYKGIQMRSRLEAGFAQWLDRWEMPWEYEPRAFASDAGQYLPDFCVQIQFGYESATAYIEVKPHPPSPQTMDRLARQMSVIHDSEPDAVLLVAEGSYIWWLHKPGSWGLCQWSFDPIRALPPILGVWMRPKYEPWNDEYWNVD
jgi:hypothetical protein